MQIADSDFSVPATMRAAVYRGNSAIAVETVPTPEVGPGELLVRVESCGVCHTDLKKVEHNLLPPPRIFGHETAGVVVRVGDGVAAFALGEGQISGIVETPTAFYLVKVLKVEGGKVTSFEDAQEDIEKVLVDEQIRRIREKMIVSKAPTLDRSSRLEDVALEKATDRYWKK